MPIQQLTTVLVVATHKSDPRGVSHFEGKQGAHCFQAAHTIHQEAYSLRLVLRKPASSAVNKVANEHIIAQIDISCAMIGRAYSQFSQRHKSND